MEKIKTPISVIVPVYNEAGGVKNTVDTLHRTLSSSFEKYEIILVDDGSSDNSSEILKSFSHKNLSIQTHPVNKGYGASLKTGIRKAKYDIVGIIDADLTYPPEKFPKLISFMDRYDMVVGARKGRYRKTPLIKSIPKFILDKIANIVVGKKIEDINSGFRVFRKKDAKKYFHLVSDRFSFTTTITLSFLSSGRLIKYVPIEFEKREGKSKVNAKTGLDFMGTIVKAVMYFNPLRILAPPAFILMGLGFLKFLFDLYEEPYLNITDSAVLLFLTGFQILVLGLLADLISTLSKPR